MAAAVGVLAGALGFSLAGGSRADQEFEIQVAAFSYMLNPSGSPSDVTNKNKKHAAPGEVYFLDSDIGKDLEDRLIQRFAGHQPPVKKVSESFIGWSKNCHCDRVVDKKTKKIGTLYTVSNLKWLSWNRVSITGGWSADSQSHGGHYLLVRRWRGWRVKEYVNEWQT